MKTVRLSVSDQIADRLSKMTQLEINAIMSMVQAVLDDKRSLDEIIHTAQEQGKTNGLTQERLNQILGEL